MNKLSFLFCVLLMVGMVACSSKSPQEDALEDSGMIATGDNAEALEIAEDSLKDDAQAQPQAKESEPQAMPAEETSESMTKTEDTSGSMIKTAETTDSMVKTAGIEYYEVQAGDTLMLIAFKIYGDYLKWKNIARLNEAQLSGNYALTKGMRIKYESPASRFNWNPAGDPYLIVRGDTLGKISNKVYSTPKYWKDIWENNKPMIKSPSLIFAGFTLYYLPLRDIASR
jgi:nucleoid-associated protein YgaU